MTDTNHHGLYVIKGSTTRQRVFEFDFDFDTQGRDSGTPGVRSASRRNTERRNDVTVRIVRGRYTEYGTVAGP